MSPEVQRIAISEACGWKEVAWSNPLGGWFGIDPFRPQMGAISEVPDYLRDLNAMMSAIRACIVGDETKENTFLERLYGILDNRAEDETTRIYKMEMAVLTADCSELAECFLVATGKWVQE